ncbi:MAG: ATP-binding protein [bacterium]
MTAPATIARILIVEDSATQAAALADLLVHTGYDTRIARSAEQGLDMLGREQFDLVLSDVVMPGMDGYEFTRRIRASAAWAEVPIVLLTSLSDPLAIVRGLAAGADHYVTKPYAPEWLLTRLRQVLDRANEPLAFKPKPITVDLLGTLFTIRATKEQILELLVSSYSDLARTSDAVSEAERRARFLADAGELLSSSLDAHQVLRELAQLAVPRVAEVCAADLLDGEGVLRRVEIAHVIGSTVPIRSDIDDRRAVERSSPAVMRAMEQRTTQEAPAADSASLADVARDGPLAIALAASGPYTQLVVPLVARDRVLGVLQFLLAVSRPHAPEDLLFLEDLTRRAALAVDNALLYGEAQRATRARDDVLAIVSHDLRNPLNTIQMSASFLIDVLGTPGAEPPPVIPQLEIIRRATRRANALIQDLLDVSRIDAGTLAVANAPTSARQLLQDAAQEQEPIVLAKQLTLVHTWTGTDVNVAADRSRIGQVFSNLVGNAVKFTERGGTITLRGERVGDDVLFEIADDGAGIAIEHLPHLFDRFWQATQTSRAGAGLGLYIVKGIVDAHRGRVEVVSAPGEGTSFRFTLPIATDVRSAHALPPSA